MSLLRVAIRILAEIRRLNKTLTIAYSNILIGRFSVGEIMPNCQNCGKEISVEGICETCANAHQQPAPATAPSKMPVMAIVAIIAIVAVIIVVIILVFAGGSSPTGTLDNFVDNYNSGDLDAALDYTDAHFMTGSEFDQRVEDMEEDTDPVTISNMKSRYLADMTSEEIEDAEDTVDGMEEEYDIQIDEFCMVDFTITSEGETDNSEMLSIKVDGKWYLVIFGYYSSGSDYVSTPVGSWVNAEATDSSSGKLTFGMFSDDVSPEDIRIFITEGSTTYEVNFNGALSDQRTDLVVSPSGIEVEYFDYNYQGNQINSGDYIELSGLDPGTTYTFEIFHIPTDSTMFMTGNGNLITPP